MSILTFNCSTSDRHALAQLKCPFQIMPGGHKCLSAAELATFEEMNNDSILIHMNYITRPFSNDISAVTKLNIKNCVKLAHRLGTRHILVHMPSNISEYNAYVVGLDFLLKEVCDKGCILQLETNPLSKELRNYLEIDKGNAAMKYYEYTNRLLASIPKKYKDSVHIVVDTAHLFSNGLLGEDMPAYIQRYLNIIDFIHLNGNLNSILTRDNHVPMYDSRNRIDSIDDLMDYLSSIKRILVTENSTEKGDYKHWQSFCKKYELTLVAESPLMSI